MASNTNPTLSHRSSSSGGDEQAAAAATAELEKELESFISTLPKCPGFKGMAENHQYKGFWYGLVLPGVIAADRQLHQLVDRPPSVMLASYPESGTTWLKALIFAIKTRTQFNICDPSSTHPLKSYNPHELVPCLQAYSQNNLLNPISDASILSTHTPFSLLSETFSKSDFPIVYVYREPRDVIVSLWHFINKKKAELGLPLDDLEELVDHFCRGRTMFGPYCDHVSEYWDASVQMPTRVLFITYEDLRKDPIPNVKRLAEFMGCPFSVEEEQQGLVRKIIDLCGFENLSKLEPNKYGSVMINKKANFNLKNDTFFRKGEVGDYKNYLSPAMVERIDAMLDQNLKHLKLN